VSGLLAKADDVLRGRPGPGAGRLAGYVALCGACYGGVMGTFGGLAGDRPWQVAFSAVKVPLLLLATLALSLPSFFVLNTLLGVRADFARALRVLVAAQAGLTITLVALAPLTAFWYASSADYPTAILFNALMFAVASLGAQVIVRRGYRPLIARSRKHLWLLRAWVVVYAFVGIQMGWVLRPFVGNPGQPVQFFRDDSWGNAYVVVARILWGVLAR
jgi:hypothetical protein